MFVILFAGCSFSWSSKLQTLVMINTTKAKYVALSEALHIVIPLIGFRKELHQLGLLKKLGHLVVYCCGFEDNLGALEVARLPKVHTKVKYINIAYHHFCEHMHTGGIQIFPIDTK